VALVERPNVLLCIDQDALDRSDSSLSPRGRGIAPETVKSHCKRIFLKLTVCSRAQAVYRAAALGLIALQ
jgi:hypothetical protein